MKHYFLRNALFRNLTQKIAILVLAIIPGLVSGQYLETFNGQNGKGLVSAICPPSATGISDCGSACTGDPDGLDNTSTCSVVPPDMTGITWTITGNNFTGFDHSSPDDFGVVGDRFQVNDPDNEMCWVSPTLLIGSAGPVSISIDAGETGTPQSDDYIRAEYSLDGGAFIQFGFASADFNSTTFTISNLSGNTLVIRVCVDQNGESESIWFDNVSVPTSNVIIDPCGPIGDSDLDGVCNDVDGCPNDPNKTEPGNCGCGVPEITPPVFTGLADICVGDGVQVLGGGQPAGGVYSGPGVTDNNNGSTFTFNPTAAGTFTVVYTVGSGGCDAEACSQLTVHPLPAAPQTQTIDACAVGSTEIFPVASGGGCTGQKVLFIESFETDGEQTRYDATLETIGTPDAYFNRVTDADLNIDYNGEVGSYYWAGEDHDNLLVGNGDPSLQIDFSAGGPTTNIVGETGVVFKGLFAANPNSPFSPNGSGANVGEPDSYLRVDYQIDAGFWIPALQFARSAGGVGLSLDTDFDGVGDCDLLTRDFKEFSFPIPTPGPGFKLRIFMHVDETGEEYAIDNFGIYADGPADCLFNFYDANPDLGPANLLAGPTASYDPHNTTTQSYWVTQVNSYGCEGPATEFVVQINQPVVTFTAPSLDVCVEDGIITGLGGGSPSGGVYSGTGVTDENNGSTFSFNPSATAGGNITVTYTLPGGCSSSASDEILVKTVCCNPPVANCVTGPVSLVLNGAGAVPLLTLQVDAGSTAGCGLQGLSVSPGSFNCASIGIQTVTLTVTDNKGDTDACTTTVNVLDLTSPSLICPGDVSFNNQANQCGRGIDVPTPVANDNCGIANLVARYRLVDQLGIPLGSFSGYSANPSGFYDVGRYEMEWLATDPSGNQNTCSFYIQINDAQAPTALCKDITVQMSPSHTATITGADIDNGSSDNCGIGALTPSITNFDCNDVGTTSTVTLTVTDVNGNSSTCTSNVTAAADVNPCCDPPQAFCKNVTVQLDAAGDASITTGDIDNGSTADCGLQSLSLSQTDFDCADVGIKTVTLTVTDNNGNISTCTANVEVEDNVAPTALCMDITAQLNISGIVTVFPASLNNGSFDNCGIATLGGPPTVYNCGNVGSNTLTLTVEDINGNTSTCTANVTVQDNTPPIAVCKDITLQLGINHTASLAGDDINNGSGDACGAPIRTPSQTSFDCDDLGPNTVTLTVFDTHGNSATCTSTVTVADDNNPCCAPPQALCKNATVQLDANGDGTLAVGDVDNGSTAGCGLQSIGIDVTSFDCNDTGTPATVTLTITDINNDQSACTATVTVEDNVAPTALCQNVTVQLNAAGSGSASAAAVNNGSDDACGVQSTVLSQQSFSCGDVGANTVTLTVTDVNDNSSTCTATVTVEDNVAPTALCQNVTVQLNAAGSGSTTASAVNNGSNDACGIQSTVLSGQSFSCADIGANTVTLTVTDNNGNVSTCTATVTVEDNVAPTALCQNVTVQLNAAGAGSTTAAAVNNGSGDACSTGPVSLSLSQTAFDCGDVGGNTVTLTATDDNNNASTCTATVTVEDNVAPTALCQNVTVQLNAAGSGSASAAAVNNGSDDACGVQSTVLSQQSFSCGDVGANTVTLTVTDVNDNSSTCTATVTVEDNVAPTALCQNVTVQLNAAGSGSTTASAVNNGSNDACGIQSAVLSGQSFSCGDVGANTVTLTVTDVNDNSSTCTATVTVEDNVAPVALCQNVTVQLNAAGSGSTTASAVNNGSGDACGVQSTVLSQQSFSCGDVGSNTVTLTVTDVNDNASTCTATVTVEDNVAPTALCQNVTVQLNAAGSGSASAAAVNNGSNDACGLQSTVLSQQSFSCGDVGSNSVTLTVTDVNDNASTCTATVTVEDNVAPVALCQNVTVQLNAAGSGSASAAAVNNGSNDACGVQSTVLSQQSFSCGDVGGNTVTLTVTDVNDNASTCTATVTVEDNVAPAALCQNVTVQLDANGDGSTTAAAVDNGSNDACGVQSAVLSLQSFSCEDVGANTVTLTVTDVNDNTSTCTATVSVEDNVNPVALCNNITVLLNEDGQGEITAQQVDNGSSDACGVQTLELNQTKFGCDNVGTVVVTLVATDVNGNQGSCPATITVLDPVAPEALCQNVTVQLDENGDGSTTPEAVDNGSNDACGIQSAVLSQQSFSCGDVGANTVTLTVTDVNDNVSTCTATVTVEDNVAPDAVCQNVTVQLDENGAASLTAEAVNNGSSDACGIQSAVLSGQSFSCVDVGANTVTLTVTDVNGNASTCMATVTVEDNIDPEVDCPDITVTFNGQASFLLDPEGMAAASDNCAVTGFEADPPSISCADLGEIVPVTVTVQDPSGNTASCIAHVTTEGLPCGWMSMPDGIGCTNGNDADYNAPNETFTLMASGCYTPSATSDESGYIKYQLCGNGSITAHIAGLTLPGFAGIVMRESDAPGAKKVAMAYQGASAIARYVRYTDNGAAYPSYINAFGARWLRIVRTGNIFRGYYSVNGVTWTYAFAVTVPMNNCIQVGLIAWGTNANSVVTATFDHVVIDPPFGGGVMRGGDEDQTEAIPATDLPVMELWPNPSTGIFTLTLDSAWSASKTTSMVNIQVADELGRVIREEKVDAAIEAMVNFDLSGQAPGMYFVKITDAAGGTQVQKLVIAR